MKTNQPEYEYETVYVAADWCFVDGRSLVGAPANTPGDFFMHRFAAGEVLPETVRADTLAHLVSVNQIVPIHIPVTSNARSNKA